MTFWVKLIFGIDIKIKFILLLFERWPCMYKTVSRFSGNVILRTRPLKFPICVKNDFEKSAFKVPTPIVLDMTDCRRCRILCGEMF